MKKGMFIQLLQNKIDEAKQNIASIQQNFCLEDVAHYANVTAYHYRKEQVIEAENQLLKWQQVVQEILKAYYGNKDDINCQRFNHTIVATKSGFNLKDELSEEYQRAIAVLEGILEGLELLGEESNPIDKVEIQEKSTKNIFVVHGHDDAKRVEIEAFLRSIGYEPIVLFKEPNKGKTIIEKIEDNVNNVCYAIVLYTPCDLGHDKDVAEAKPRARQNVVFEHGYMCAKLGREHVCALYTEGVELPGDMSGVVYTKYDDVGLWKYSLAKEMIAVGLQLDMNKIR